MAVVIELDLHAGRTRCHAGHVQSESTVGFNHCCCRAYHRKGHVEFAAEILGVYFVPIMVDEDYLESSQCLAGTERDTAGSGIACHLAFQDLIQDRGSLKDLDALGFGMFFMIVVVIGRIAVTRGKEEEGKNNGKQARSPKKSRFHGSNG